LKSITLAVAATEKNRSDAAITGSRLHEEMILMVPPERSCTVPYIQLPALLIERYPRTLGGRRGLDFKHLPAEYDGLHLTNEGYLSTRSARSGPALVGWDCESTLWFRWIFSEWHEVKQDFKDVDRFDDLWLRLSGWSTEDYTCRRMPAEKASKKVYETMLSETVLSKEKRREILFDLPDI